VGLAAETTGKLKGVGSKVAGKAQSGVATAGVKGADKGAGAGDKKKNGAH
jgi:hypothetical protein